LARTRFLSLLAWTSACGFGIACNAIWGVDQLEYDGQGSGATSSGAGGGDSGGSTVVGGQGASASGGSGTAAGPTGGSGGSLCVTPCTTPPNAECYEAVGTCDPLTGDCSYPTKADGTTCGETSCPEWSVCSWDGECSSSGTRARTCTDYICSAGNCTSGTHDESDPCSRTVDNGTGCSAGYCCSHTCVARHDENNCGSCGVSCSGSTSCVQLHDHSGQYSCTCTYDSTCQGEGFGSGATCYDDLTQKLCNCQCPGGATSCTGQCAGGGICSDTPGQNYCHY
jgi:hypothetical protein